MHEITGRWDTAYEWKAVTVLSLGFGLVGFDRWIITPLFPFIMRDLHLNYSQIGALAGILAVFWGVSAILMGGISDRIGRRRILIPTLLLFSALAGVSGLATSFGMLMLLRSVMGFTEGAFTPPSVASTAEASKPSRRGLNQGLQVSLFSLLGFALGPILATQLLKVVPSWRYVFLLAAIPGFILTVFMYFTIREPQHRASDHGYSSGRWINVLQGWINVLQSRNVILSVLGLLCSMCCVFVLGAMMPNYLIDYLRLTPPQMGFVMSGIGFGGFFGQFTIPGLSDLFGRRLMAVLSFLVGAVLVQVFMAIGAQPTILFVLLFFIGFCCMGLLALFTGPVPTEAVSPLLIATAVGVVSGTGEIFGGGIAPAIAGWIAQTYGIQHVLDLAFGGMGCGVVLSFFLKESAPRLRESGDRQQLRRPTTATAADDS